LKPDNLQITFTLSDITKAAGQFWEKMCLQRIFTFDAEMGAGKTTFIHALCDFLQVKDAVSSPTFALINEYRFSENGTEKKIYHMDWYRIKDENEAIQAGLEDALNDKNAICFIEWPQNASGIIPISHTSVHIHVVNETTRSLQAIVVI